MKNLGTGEFPSKHPGSLRAKLCLACCAETPSLGGKCLQKCGAPGTLHKTPPFQPCHDSFGLLEKSQLLSKSLMPIVAQGPTALPLALCNWSNRLPIPLPALFNPESQSCTHSDFSNVVNLQIIQTHLIETERRN